MDACFGLDMMRCACGANAQIWVSIPLRMYRQLTDKPSAPETITSQQALITLGKYICGYRPGDDGWSAMDDQCLSAATCAGGRFDA